jgi:hypothetical protein
MENLITTEVTALRRIATDYRSNASCTDLSWFSMKMNDAADELDMQAGRLERADAAYQFALSCRCH